jgi:hypothetical protein
MVIDLADWLVGLGLGKYARAFVEQEIEIDHPRRPLPRFFGTDA